MSGPKERCAICGWPLADTRENGCVRGNCSMRPVPAVVVDPERAIAEGYDREWVNERRGVRLPATDLYDPAYEDRLRDEAAMRFMAAMLANPHYKDTPWLDIVAACELVAKDWIEERRKRKES